MARRARAAKTGITEPLGPTPELAARSTVSGGHLRHTVHPLDRLQLVGDQRRAAGLIERAYHLVVAGTEARTMRLDGLARGCRAITFIADVAIERAFVAWAQSCNRARLPLGPVLDVIVEGTGCRVLDRRWRRRDGWTAKLVRAALDLYVPPEMI